LPEKKEAHFAGLCSFWLVLGDTIGNALWFLDRSGTCRTSKMYFYYCMRMPFGKGKIWGIAVFAQNWRACLRLAPGGALDR
jgi:hypothetical protein